MTTLTAFAETYPYLAGCLFASLLFLACIFLSKEQSRPMLLSALLFTPFALTAIILVPSYWRPKLFWDLVVGVEDVIFCPILSTSGICRLFPASFSVCR